MTGQSDTDKMAVFCDFENIALGVRDLKNARFDMGLIVERLLLKGSILVKKAYCDWDRYREFKQSLHEASFELIEIPHVRQSGKNSADIHLVVDALDLCYTKSHVGTFVIVSGDSDFSPLVSKLRENNKMVIGLGVKNSTSDLLVANCDEFIFYDDLLRGKASRQHSSSSSKGRAAKASTTPDGAKREDPKLEAFDLVITTVGELFSERGDEGKIWGSMVKQALKRRKPDFSEGFYGFSSFSDLLEEAQARGLLQLTPDDKSGGYTINHPPKAE